ncbi:MDR family MFS transporter [Lentilactobacillus kosonis]|uniref:Permease of the major facilitator superfamily n=1 Tax=Lentilactobacillus kosonis TaxID=2810561 RepID=A0A401FMU8_9LACO|nr:MFS transporter [Lentilactobacillus kosonis]GAY73712.1 permease of the major facilitator superfamily [Lentilactobacillus kosonis]
MLKKRSEVNLISVIACSLLLNAGAAFMWPLVTIYMHNYLHKSLTLAGMSLLLMSCCMMLGNYLGERLFDKWSPYSATILSVSFSTIAIFILIFFHGWPIFTIMLLFVGFGDGACMTLFNAYAATIKSQSTRTIFNVLYIGTNLGVVIGTLLVGFLLKYGVATVFTVAFGFYIGLLILTITMFNVDIDKREDSGSISESGSTKVNTKAIIAAICLVVLTVYLSYTLWESVISVHMTELGISFEKYSLLWTLNGLMIVFLQPFVNRIGEKFKLSTQTYVGIFIFAIAFLGLIFAKNYTAFVIVMIVTTIGEMIGFPGVPAWIDSLSGPSERGKYQGIYNLFMSFGRAVGPLIGGFIIDFASYQYLFGFAAGIIIITLAGLIIVNWFKQRQLDQI